MPHPGVMVNELVLWTFTAVMNLILTEYLLGVDSKQASLPDHYNCTKFDTQ